jgi:hemerythrin-like domain-containing protein
MTSCHLHLDRPAAAAAAPATADLRHDHDVILRALALLEQLAERVAAGRPVPDGALAELVPLVQTFADRCHHGKEEDHLFPAMRGKGAGGALAVFEDEHERGRQDLRTLAGDAPAGERVAAARRYVGLLRDHIERENAVLFPLADSLFSPDEHAELARAYARVEDEVVGPAGHEPLVAALGRLEAAAAAGAGER